MSGELQKHSGEIMRQSGVSDLLQNLTEKKELANILIKSKLIPSTYDTPEKVLVAIFKAQELNVPTMEALGSMAVINGKVTLQGNLILAMINRAGRCKKINIKEDKSSCTVTMSRKDYELEYTVKFSLEDAQKAGLLGKDIWKKYPEIMLKWRAVSMCARVVFPEVIGGLYTPEEIASIDDSVHAIVDEDGNIITEPIKDKPKEEKKPEVENAQVAQITTVLQGEEIKPRNYTDEASKITDLESLRIWWNKIANDKTISEDEKKRAGAVKDNRKNELIPPRSIDEANAKIDLQEKANQSAKDLKAVGNATTEKKVAQKPSKAEINVLRETIQNIPFNVTEPELKVIDDMLNDYNKSDKGQLIDLYKEQLSRIGSKHEYTKLPF